MSIFGRSQTGTDVSIPVYEGYGVEVNGDIIALQESFEDQLAVVEALHSIDMEELSLRGDVRSLQESGAEAQEIEAREQQFVAVTESAVANAWQKIKEFFTKLLGKLKAFFASVVRFFDGIFKSGADFAKKYEGQLKKLDLSGFEYKMHTYTGLEKIEFDKADVVSEMKKLRDEAVEAATDYKKTDAIKEEIRQCKEDREEYLNTIRGTALKSGGSVTAEQYAEALYGSFRNGAKDNDDAKEQAVRINDIVAVLKDTKAKTSAEAFAKKTEEEFDKAIKFVEELRNKFANAKEKSGGYTVKHGDKEHAVFSDAAPTVIEGLRVTGAIMSAGKDIQVAAFRAWKDAYTERARVYKSVCMSAFRYKKKN
jgi:hypothetical protein